MTTPAISIVIPVYNEKDNLAELLNRCLGVCRPIGRNFELILVDDGSKDGSRDIISQAADREPEVIGVLLNRNYGQHAAVFAGLEQSRGEIVITLDADLQNPPEEIPRLVREIEHGVDVVDTVRQNRQDSFFRRFASTLVNRMVQQATGVAMRDYGCMLRAYVVPWSMQFSSVTSARLSSRSWPTLLPAVPRKYLCSMPPGKKGNQNTAFSN